MHISPLLRRFQPLPGGSGLIHDDFSFNRLRIARPVCGFYCKGKDFAVFSCFTLRQLNRQRLFYEFSCPAALSFRSTGDCVSGHIHNFPCNGRNTGNLFVFRIGSHCIGNRKIKINAFRHTVSGLKPINGNHRQIIFNNHAVGSVNYGIAHIVNCTDQHNLIFQNSINFSLRNLSFINGNRFFFPRRPADTAIHFASQFIRCHTVIGIDYRIRP